MSRLLVPIDFIDYTSYSKTALRYACAIAKTHGLTIDLIHAFNDHDSIYADAKTTSGLKDPRVPQAEQKAKKIVEKLNEKHPAVEINVLLYDGNLYNAINKQADLVSYEALVISKKGSSGLESIFLGSPTYSTITNTKLPVLAVPVGDRVFKKDRIALLCNFKEAELAVLRQAIPILGNNFELILIHVNKDNKAESALHTEFQEFAKQIKSEFGLEKVKCVTKPQSYYAHTNKNVSTTIDQVLTEEEIDIVLVTKSKKSLFRNLTEENIVKNMTYQLNIPKFFAKVNPSVL